MSAILSIVANVNFSAFLMKMKKKQAAIDHNTISTSTVTRLSKWNENENEITSTWNEDDC